MLNYDEYTMKDYISNYKETDITFDKLYLKEVISSDNGKMIITSDCILDKYSGELDKLKTKYTIGESERQVLMYNPKALSYKLYGTTELWFLLLYANQMHSASEFCKETINVYAESIIAYIVEIINLETTIIESNRTAVNTELLNT